MGNFLGFYWINGSPLENELASEALSFWLGFWIALIGMPNYALTARKFIYGPLVN